MSVILRLSLLVFAVAALAAWTHGFSAFGFLLDNSSAILTTDTGDNLVGT